ncbi:pilus assembly FimT family protein [Vibrio harveyi]|uniref:pilus assembly FimT family protein n=1 Tax=Vibrio harveyi TaxID=669 RepID=UPI00238076B2|nr:type II secretion system protein [Vibrio harveyi]
MKSNKGFTIIEMLLSVTIVAILANVSIPYFTSAYQSFKADRMFSEFSTALRNARVESIADNEEVKVIIHSDMDSYYLSFSQKNDQTKQITLSKEDFELAGGNVTYKPEGYAVVKSTNDNLYELCHKHSKEQHNYQINPIGKMDIEITEC